MQKITNFLTFNSQAIVLVPYLTLPYLNRDWEVKRPLGLKIPLSSSSLTTGQADLLVRDVVHQARLVFVEPGLELVD